jgi:hypothetical protein
VSEADLIVETRRQRYNGQVTLQQPGLSDVRRVCGCLAFCYRIGADGVATNQIRRLDCPTEEGYSEAFYPPIDPVYWCDSSVFRSESPCLMHDRPGTCAITTHWPSSSLIGGWSTPSPVLEKAGRVSQSSIVGTSGMKTAPQKCDRREHGSARFSRRD